MKHRCSQRAYMAKHVITSLRDKDVHPHAGEVVVQDDDFSPVVEKRVSRWRDSQIPKM